MYDNWNGAWDLPPGPERTRQIRLVEHLLRGNFQWFVRQVIGNPNDPAYKIHGYAMCKQSDFIRRTRILLNEDTFS